MPKRWHLKIMKIEPQFGPPTPAATLKECVKDLLCYDFRALSLSSDNVQTMQERIHMIATNPSLVSMEVEDKIAFVTSKIKTTTKQSSSEHYFIPTTLGTPCPDLSLTPSQNHRKMHPRDPHNNNLSLITADLTNGCRWFKHLIDTYATQRALELPVRYKIFANWCFDNNNPLAINIRRAFGDNRGHLFNYVNQMSHYLSEHITMSSDDSSLLPPPPPPPSSSPPIMSFIGLSFMDDEDDDDEHDDVSRMEFIPLLSEFMQFEPFANACNCRRFIFGKGYGRAHASLRNKFLMFFKHRMSVYDDFVNHRPDLFNDHVISPTSRHLQQHDWLGDILSLQ
jgi:hypothetical protein